LITLFIADSFEKKKSKLNQNDLHSDQLYQLGIKEIGFIIPIMSLLQEENKKAEAFSIGKNNPFHRSVCNYVSCLLLLAPSFRGYCPH